MAYSACLVTPGSENMANDHEGSPGTWETLPFPSGLPAGARLTNSRWIHRFLVPSEWGRTGDNTMVSPSEVAIEIEVGMPQ